MTHNHRRLRAMTAMACLAASGCSTIREVPRSEYAARPERQRVTVETRDSLHYTFDYASFGSDSLTGFRMRETEGAFEEYHSVPIAFDAIEKLSVRKTSWLRTGLIIGGVIAIVATTAVARRNSSNESGENPPELPPVP